jgi:hypothetical protein
MFIFDRGKNQWATIIDYGSVMMRPVFGKRIPTGFCEKDIDPTNVKIYPNPSDGLVFVESPETLVESYEIYDLTGRKLVQNSCHDSQLSIRLPEQTGVYILLLNTEKGIISKKIIRR